jgi:hypothetical protein
VVVLEVLGKIMSAVVNMGLLLGFLVGSRNKEELLVSHLLFIDTVIFL